MSSTQRVWAQRLTVMVLWVSLMAWWWTSQRASGLSAAESAQQLVDEVSGAWWGILAFVGIYLLRPLVLFPATLLTIAAGILFGPYFGIGIVVIAANASAMVAYGVGRILGRPPSDTLAGAESLGARWAARLRRSSFETVLMMRLLFLPYDLVNYACGVMRIRVVPFLAATAIGSVPGTVAFVLLGASLDRIDTGVEGLRADVFVASLVLFVASLVLARALRRRSVQEIPT